MLILGIDPGLANIGLALLEWSPQGRSQIIALETVTTPPGQTQPRIETIVARFTPLFVGVECMGIEEQERAWQGHQKKGKTSSKSVLARVGEGCARTMAVERRIPVIELLPSRTRTSLGLAGNAEKALVLSAVKGLFRVQGRHSSHALDALAIAHATGARWSILRQRPGALLPRT